MEIKRDRYLNKLISFMWDGQVKVITGIRRCGKSSSSAICSALICWGRAFRQITFSPLSWI